MSDSRSGGLAGGLSGGLKMAAVALLLHQLMKHAQATGQANAPQPAPQAGQGGGWLDGLLRGGGLGGLLSGGLLSGLGSLLGQARAHGLSPQVDSWVASGPNQAVSGQQLAPLFDDEAVDAAARHAGTDRGSLLEALGQMLPQLVDRASPEGRLPLPGEPAASQGLATELRGMLGGLDPQR